MSTSAASGVYVPVVTPFDRELRPDLSRLEQQCRWLLLQGAGLAIFGTNSEANSLTVDERLALLHGLVERGVDPQRIMPGTGCCAFPDTVQLSRAATQLGCVGVLMLPPFYYEPVSDEGLFRVFAEIIERVADDRLRIYLYNIPQLTHVPIPLAVIGRLLDRYPGQVAGIKDTSGDWPYTQGLLEQFAPRGFSVFTGSELILLKALRLGGVGCISAMANLNPGRMLELIRHWQSPEAEALQADLARWRNVFPPGLLIPALKAVIADGRRDPEWTRVRPPLVEFPADETHALLARLREQGLVISGLAPE